MQRPPAYSAGAGDAATHRADPRGKARFGRPGTGAGKRAAPRSARRLARGPGRRDDRAHADGRDLVRVTLTRRRRARRVGLSESSRPARRRLAAAAATPRGGDAGGRRPPAAAKRCGVHRRPIPSRAPSLTVNVAGRGARRPAKTTPRRPRWATRRWWFESMTGRLAARRRTTATPRRRARAAPVLRKRPVDGVDSDATSAARCRRPPPSGAAVGESLSPRRGRTPTRPPQRSEAAPPGAGEPQLEKSLGALGAAPADGAAGDARHPGTSFYKAFERARRRCCAAHARREAIGRRAGVLGAV